MFPYNSQYTNPAMPSPYGYQYQQTAQRQEIIKVHGEEGAKAYQMPPNSSALLLDEINPLVWVKSTDGAGFPTIQAYTLSPYEPEQKPDGTGELERRISRLEELYESYITNASEQESTECAVTDPADSKFSKWKKS